MLLLTALHTCNSLKVELPYSKSLSNRLLIIDKLLNNALHLEGLDGCDDTRVMQQQFSETIDIEGAGTAMRFLTAYLALKGKSHVLTGDKRMQERPIAPLVNALRELGADIQYIDKQGYPPLKISARPMQGGTVVIDATLSSQYISSLLLIAPYLSSPLEIRFQGQPVSLSYINMTIELMRVYGAKIAMNTSSITVQNTGYTQVLDSTSIEVERDWTAASYACAWVCLNPELTISLPDLDIDSIQGDAQIAQRLYGELGLKLHQKGKAICIQNTQKFQEKIHWNVRNNPDIVQTFVVVCCIKGIAFQFDGVSNLRIKETDRLIALQKECSKMGYILIVTEDSIIWDGNSKCTLDDDIVFNTYGDHRMAMSLALFCTIKPVVIRNPEVVSKSFPNYWEAFNKCFKKIKI